MLYGGCEGVIAVQSTRPGAFGPEHQRLLESLALQIAVAPADSVQAYYGTFSRLYQLLAGALLASLRPADSLDPATEASLYQALIRELPDSAMIVITHRPVGRRFERRIVARGA